MGGTSSQALAFGGSVGRSGGSNVKRLFLLASVFTSVGPFVVERLFLGFVTAPPFPPPPERNEDVFSLDLGSAWKKFSALD
jgi:hypothetical protein